MRIHMAFDGELNPVTLLAITNHAYALRRSGRLVEVDPICVKVVRLRREVLGTANPATLAAQRAIFGDRHPEMLITAAELELAWLDSADHGGVAMAPARLLVTAQRGDAAGSTSTAPGGLRQVRADRDAAKQFRMFANAAWAQRLAVDSVSVASRALARTAALLAARRPS